MAVSKPFKVKGFKVTTPIGKALWCKVVEPDYRYNPKGIYEVSLVLEQGISSTDKFIEVLTNVLEKAQTEAKSGVGDMKLAPPKIKSLNINDIFKEEYDSDGNETGNIIFKFSLKEVDDLPEGKNKIPVFDSQGKRIVNVPLVGNGSKIRVKGYANPYYMAATNTIGIALKWEALQIVDLVAYAGSDGFDAVDGGFSEDTDEAPFNVEESDDF